MMTRRMFPPISVLALASLCTPGAAQNEAVEQPPQTSEQQAQKVAEAWLAVVERGEYGKSWNIAADFFKKNVTSEQWIRALDGIRTPLGRVQSRILKEARYTTSLPGVPDGHYVVVQFDTSFTEKEAAVETVSVMKEPDGAWLVAGYFIR